jgi:hypothetical protein
MPSYTTQDAAGWWDFNRIAHHNSLNRPAEKTLNSACSLSSNEKRHWHPLGARWRCH